MGFIESLRQIKEKEALREQKTTERLQQKQQAQAAVAEAQRKKEERAAQLQEEHRNQALQLRDESGIQQLLRELCELDKSLSWSPPERRGLTGESVRDHIEWPSFETGPLEETKHSNPGTRYARRYFEIETRYDGDIIFHCNAQLFGRPVVSEKKWRTNKDALETALGKAYFHPGTEDAGYTGGETKEYRSDYFGGG